MKIKILGTAAAEGWPALFCECEACKKAEQLGGKDIRTRSSCLIDDKYMIDFSADTYMHKLVYKLNLANIEHIFITHSHYDHFYPNDFEIRGKWFAHINNLKPLYVYGNEKVKARFNDAVGNMDIEKYVRFYCIEPFKNFNAGEANIIPLIANHDPNENCYIYIIEIKGKKLLYGHDTGYFSEATWLEALRHKFHGVILDCTFGHRFCRDGHMGIHTCNEIKERIIENQCSYNDTKFIITHFSHNINKTHSELELLGKEYGFLTAFDGLEIEL